MANQLLVRLNVDGSYAWLMRGVDGRALSAAQAGVPSAAELASAQRVVVLVPAEQVLLLDAPAISKHRTQLAKAVPFALEERLASPVEDLHIALAEQPENGSIAAAVVSQRALRGWLDALGALGIRPDVLIPETLAMPPSPDCATLVIDGQRALLRKGSMLASACDLGSLPIWIEAASPEALEIYDFRAAKPLPLRGVKINQYHERQRDVLAFFAHNLPEPPELNLLDGAFAPQHRQMPALRLWRMAAMLAGGALLLATLYAAGDWLRLSRESDGLELAMRGVLHASFPKFAHVEGDSFQLMQSELARLHGDSAAAGVLGVLKDIAPVLGASSRAVLKGIEYHNTTLELTLRAPDVPALDLIRERIDAVGSFKAEVTSITTAPSNGEGVEGRLRLSAGKS